VGFHRRVTLLVTAAALCASGCRTRRAVEDEHAAPASVPPVPVAARSAAQPVDQTLPGELAEGSVRAFGFPLPRVMTVKGQFAEVVFAAGQAPADQVANYVRQRVTADKILTGPEKTVFSRAAVKATPGPLMTISVVSRGDKTEIEVRDITPKPAKEGLTPEERWRALGLNPDGSPIDPTQLH
jgi:hypothetical protein